MNSPREESSEEPMAKEAVEAVLRQCDFVMARDEILNWHRQMNEQARQAGGQHYFPKEYVAAWYAFRDNPNIETARAFLTVAPPVFLYFEGCSPGGELYETNSLIKRMAEPALELDEDDGLCTRGRIHLIWMFENQPDLLRKLHQTGTLQRYLYETLQQGLERTMQLKEEMGLSEDEAFEIATAEILAPADGPAFSDDPPEPMAWAEQQVILESLGLR